MTPLKVYIVENQPVAVQGLRCNFSRHPEIEVVGEAYDIELAIADLASASTDVLLLGQPTSAKSILPLLGHVRESQLQTAVVVWAGELSDMDLFRSLQLGARGIVRKTQPVEALLDCLRTVASGSIYLEKSMRASVSPAPRRHGAFRITAREREIIQLVCRGMKNKEIADALSITSGTVKVHLMHIFEKTGVKDRFQLALQGREFLIVGDEQVALHKAAEA